MQLISSSDNNSSSEFKFPHLLCDEMSEAVEKVDNLSAVLYGPNDLRLEQRPIPKAGPGQVLVRIHVVGICGTDLHHLVQGGNCGEMVKSPMVLGHEASGVIEELGEGVQGFAKGKLSLTNMTLQ